jgi:outer membrane protein OmpA-like peptidoglycan-associated protein
VPAAPFRAVWSAIEVSASLKIVREGPELHVSGDLPNETLKDAVIAAAEAAGPGSGVDSAALRSGVHVRSAAFADEQSLPAFLKAFFSTPGAARFEADAQSIHVSGDATPSMQREWMSLLEPLAAGAKLDARFQIHPSKFHFPGYQRESKISTDALAVLQDVLRATVINFGPGYATVDENEDAKLITAASAIVAAGADARIIVGGHVDATGDATDNMTMARRRAESVVASLAGRGVPPHVLEGAVFDPVPGGAERSRQVEFLIK